MDEAGLDDQLTHDLEQLKTLNPDHLRTLINLVLSFLLDPANSDFQNVLAAFAEEQLG